MGRSPAGTPRPLNELWLEELPADLHRSAACWHRPRSRWRSHLPGGPGEGSWQLVVRFSEYRRKMVIPGERKCRFVINVAKTVEKANTK